VNVTRSDAERFRRLVARRVGLRFDDAKLDELAELLGARTRARGASVEHYLEGVDDGELALIAERFVVGETYFFRYREQFDAFALEVVPALASRTPLRILSAGCAAGDEPYSIAIGLRERAPHVRAEVHAFDVSPAAIGRARAGRYSAWSLRETPAELRARYFTERGNAFELSDAVRAAVTFERRNLVDDDAAFWRPETFDVVFCRNVIMYFDTETMRSVIARVARSMRPGGFLFMGHAETLRGLSTDFHLCHSQETFYYRRKDALGASAPIEMRSAPRAPALQPALEALDGSWVDVIHAATSRVTKLADALERRQDTPVASVAADPDAQLLRAVTLTNDGRLAEAEKICVELLARDDLDAGAHYLLALCREHVGDLAGAMEHDRVAAFIDPGFVMPLIHLGLLERRTGSFDRAAASLSRALASLATEEPARIVMFGGGFSRESLALLCRNEVKRCKERA
jgi:chemotaxis protein methyltransferase CheR